MVGVTKWPYDQFHIDQRQADCEFYGDPSDQCHNEAWFIREMSQQFQDKFDITRSFTFAFMDSFSQAGPALNDAVQQQHWWEETLKLWEEATSKNQTFDFKTIDDVLEENAACKQENERLLDIIDENITQLFNSVNENKESIDENKQFIDENILKISELEEELDNVGESQISCRLSIYTSVQVTYSFPRCLSGPSSPGP